MDKIRFYLGPETASLLSTTSGAFWKEYENAWWKPIFNNYSGSMNKPYEFQKLRVILPLGWFPEFATESDPYNNLMQVELVDLT